MAALIVRHRVKDYEAWKSFFDEHGAVRRQHGALGHQLYRVATDPNELVVVNVFPSADAAKAFAADPSLPEAMQRAGVEGHPDIALCEEIETADYRVAIG